MKTYELYLHREQTLTNGLMLRTLNMPNTHSVSFVAHIRGGPICESLEEGGISHILEHLHLAVTPRYPSRIQMLTALDELPGSVNGATLPDGIIFKLTTTPACLSKASKLLVEILQSRSFSRELVIAEQSLVRTELTGMNDYQSGPMADLFKGHPFGRPFGGQARSIGSLSSTQLENFDRRLFRPPSMTVAVVGPLSPVDLQQLQQDFSSLTSIGEDELIWPSIPLVELPGIHVASRRAQTCSTAILFMVKGPLSPEKQLAASILEGGLTRISSPLFMALRYEAPIAYEFYPDWSDLGGLWMFWLMGETLHKYRDCFIGAGLSELQATCDSVTPRPWFEPARAEYLFAIDQVLDSPSAIADRLIMNRFGHGTDSLLTIPDEIKLLKELTWVQAQAAYRNILRPDQLFVWVQSVSRWFDKSKLARFVRKSFQQPSPGK